ncbi:MAG: phosphotransferase, partial [Anaerolineae bacterium]|nr:phosphotransferase [Anaerolineae bacterium]
GWVAVSSMSQENHHDHTQGESHQSDIESVLRLAFGRVVPTTPIPVVPGQSKRMMAFALHDRRLPDRVLLRRYSPHEQASAFRAFTVMQALHSQNFLVPTVYYFGWSYHTRFLLLLLEYIDGRSEEGQAHAFFARVGTHFAETLAHLHGLPWDPLPDLAVMPFRYMFDDLARQVQRLSTKELNIVFYWLMGQIKHIREQQHTVVHGNYTLPNVLADGTEIAAVLGWERAMLADPRIDVGYASAVLGVYGAALSDQFIDAYQSVAGPVADLAFWEVFGALRLLSTIIHRLSLAHVSQVHTLQNHAWPIWEGLLNFVEARTGLEL